MTWLVVSEGWRETFPGAAAGILAVSGVSNPSGHAGLDGCKAELEAELRARYEGLGRAELRGLPAMQAYEAHYRRFDKTYHVLLQLESVALKGRAIPRVAGLVEAMFMGELKNLLLTAAHDLAALELPIRLALADGSERYEVMRGEEQQLKAGDMYMADGGGVISSVLYGPDRRTAIGPTTTGALFAVYAPAGIGAAAVRRHLRDVEGFVRLFAPAAVVEALEVHGPG